MLRYVRGRAMRIEALENRNLLSLTVPGYATPDYAAYVAPNSVAPLSTAGPTGYTPAQIRQAYGINKISFNNGTVAGDGSGTTIAIVNAYNDPKIANDLHQFDLQFGLADPVLTTVNKTGGAALPAANGGWITEIALDVEWAHAIAPGANILLVEANSASLGDLLTAVNYARNATGVVAVSMSWGAGEFAGESAYDSYFTTPGGHGGVTFVAASGDSGAPAGYPAISPNVLSVGGTTLSLDGQGGYGSESGWSGSGGGISAYESQPGYQNGVVTQSTAYRTGPDVAYDANPGTGFPVYDSYNNPASAPWGQWGGTSDAAPQWAALVAIADQGRALAGKAALDGATQTLPMLYALPAADFHDTTAARATAVPAIRPAAGYDLVTGRGNPLRRPGGGRSRRLADCRFSPATTFSLAPTPATVTAGQFVNIQWTANGVTAGSKISLCYDTDTTFDGNEHWIKIDGVLAANGSAVLHLEHGPRRAGHVLYRRLYVERREHVHLLAPEQGDHMSPPPPQTFAIAGPISGTFTAGQTVAIQWTAGNVAAGSKISLCYDTDTTFDHNEHWIEIDGVLAANGSGSYAWNTAGVAAGTYYVAGYLWNGAGIFTFSHLTQAISIAVPSTLTASRKQVPASLLSSAVLESRSEATGGAGLGKCLGRDRGFARHAAGREALGTRFPSTATPPATAGSSIQLRRRRGVC